MILWPFKPCLHLRFDSVKIFYISKQQYDKDKQNDTQEC